MRYGVALVTVVVGLAATALGFMPLALRHTHLAPPGVFQGSTSVYAVPLRGGTPRELLRLHGQWEFPVATPDGMSLLLERPSVPSGVRLWRVSLDGARRTRLGAVRVFQQLAWSDDRREYALSDPGVLRIVRTDGTVVRRLGSVNDVASWNGDYLAGERETRPTSGYRLDVHVWRTNGRQVWSARMPFPPATVSVAADGRRVADVRMHLLELVTPHGRRVLASDAGGTAAVWTHDGRSLLYDDVAGRLVRLDVRSGAKRTVLGPSRYSEPALSADGRTVFVLGTNDAVSIPK